MTMKKIKFLTITISFIIIAVIGYIAINSYADSKKTYYLGVQSKLLKTKYDTTYRYFKIMTSDIYKMYSQNKKLINLFAKATKADEATRDKIRKEAYNKIIKNYRRLNHMGISKVQFYFKDNTTFLRMHQPSFFGDDVSGMMQSVVLTNKTKKPQEGFEACDFMVGLRFVYPVYDFSHNYIGAVEISYSLKELLKNITDHFIYDSHVLVSKSIAKNTIIQQQFGGNYKQSWEAKDYYVEEFSHTKVGNKDFYNKLNNKTLRAEIAKGIKKKKTFALTQEYNYQNIILTFLPLSSVSSIKNIAYIVTYTESDYLSNLKIEQSYIKALFFSVLFILYIFGLYVVSSQEKLRSLALYDNLTKLPNRTLFMIELKNEINRANRYKESVALMFLDLDGFKSVNDTYGHHVGDELLIYIANVITSTLRKSDLVARLGGDEFTIILSDVKNTDSVIEVAQNIINKINKDIIINHEIIHVGASIGVAIYPQHSSDIENLIKDSDSMMYESKSKGKNQVTLYNKKRENTDV